MIAHAELLDPGDCAGGCVEEAVMVDAVGYGWCEEHKYKGQLVNWLFCHNWMALDCEPYAIAPGKPWAMMQIIMGTETYIWTAIAYTEYLEAEWVRQGYVVDRSGGQQKYVRVQGE